jgi:hypothetical protein
MKSLTQVATYPIHQQSSISQVPFSLHFYFNIELLTIQLNGNLKILQGNMLRRAVQKDIPPLPLSKENGNWKIPQGLTL